MKLTNYKENNYYGLGTLIWINFPEAKWFEGVFEWDQCQS